MKKINLKKNKINLKLQRPNWQKTLVLAALASTFIFALCCLIILFRPLSKNIKEIIDKEIAETDIYFKKKTLERLEKRLEPEEKKEPSTGKNPFMPF